MLEYYYVIHQIHFFFLFPSVYCTFPHALPRSTPCMYCINILYDACSMYTHTCARRTKDHILYMYIIAILSRTPPFIYSDLELPVAVAAAAVELPIEKFGTYFFV